MRRPGVIALALILVFAMAGTVYAASRGNAWRLGYVETLNSYNTGIVGARGGGEIFKIKNTSAASGSRAMRVENGSNSATIYLKNTGTGSAAEFVTGPGRAPFKVNQTTKVTKLNADLLDGLNSSSFVRSSLALGTTESGVWGAAGPVGSYDLAIVQYRTHLPATIAEANVHYVTAPTTECPGAGQAAAGHLCIYQVFDGGMDPVNFPIWNPEDLTTGSGQMGFVIYMEATSAFGDAWGTWTVKAPTSLLGTSSSGNSAGTPPGP
jgi:hypothetical protein